jgi:hypothetical protein
MPIIELANKTPGPSLLAGPITAYLESQDKVMDESVLHEMEAMFRRSVVKQLMQPRESRKGYESNSLYSHPCARKARYTYDGAEKPPVQARTMLKFLLGDLVELTVMGLGRLAGLDIGLGNIDLTVQGEPDMKLVPVHPDGFLLANGRQYNVEIKSCDSNTFDRWLEQGGPSDDWGYRTQATVEIQAWRENMYEVNETVFVAVSTGSRQGSIAEWVLPFEPDLLQAWQERRALRQQEALPPITFQPEKEYEYTPGKAIKPETMARIMEAWGEAPKPREDKRGRVYGWDVPTGRQILPTVCSYCDYKGLCWPGAVMEEKSGKPIWVVKAA